MSDINPYQSPKVDVAETAPPAEEPCFSGKHVWRQGKLMVVRKGAVFPNRCVKTNKPAFGFRAKQTYLWYPLLFGTILSLPKYRREAVVKLPLSPKRRTRRRLCQAIGWTLVALGIGLYQSAFSVCPPLGVSNVHDIVSIAFGGIGLLLIGLFVVLFAPSVRLKVVRIQDEHVWLKGAHPDFLAALPEWPGE